MSGSSVNPMFPSLLPRLVDPLWFSVDEPIDEEAILSRLEEEHETRKKQIAKAYHDVTPIGKTSQEAVDDDDDDDDDDDNDNDDNDDSDSHDEDEDVEMDLGFAPEDNADVGVGEDLVVDSIQRVDPNNVGHGR